MVQAAIVALLEWSQTQSNVEQLSDEVMDVIDAAIASEVRNLPSLSTNDQGDGYDPYDRNYDRQLTQDQLLLCNHIRDMINKVIGEHRRVDVFWRVVLLRETPEEVADRLNRGRKQRPIVTPQDVRDWVAIDTSKLQGRIKPDLLDAVLNFDTFVVDKLQRTQFFYNKMVLDGRVGPAEID